MFFLERALLFEFALRLDLARSPLELPPADLLERGSLRDSPLDDASQSPQHAPSHLLPVQLPAKPASERTRPEVPGRAHGVPESRGGERDVAEQVES